MLKVGIIGVSGFGRRHYQDIIKGHELGKLTPIAATIINQEEEFEICEKLKSLGCKLYKDYNEMLNIHGQEMDICFIPTGIPLHAPMSIAAVQAGTNVFVEKPAAGTCAEVETMKAAEKETGKYIAVGYQNIYSQGVQNIKKFIISDKLGKINEIKSRGIWPRPRSYYDRNNWAGKLKVGENFVYDCPFNNAMSHHLNILCFLGGSVFEKSATIKDVSAELYKANDIETCDTASLIITTEEGPQLKFYTTHASSELVNLAFRIEAENGYIDWELGKSAKVFIDGKLTEEIDDPLDNIRQEIIDTLIKKLDAPDTFVCNLDIAGTQTKVTQKAFEEHTIKTVSQEYISKQATEDSTLTVIKDINETLLGAFEKGIHLSQMGFDWTSK